jgi:hypothetical protein
MELAAGLLACTVGLRQYHYAFSDLKRGGLDFRSPYPEGWGGGGRG